MTNTEITAIRHAAKLKGKGRFHTTTQKEFAETLGIPINTIRDWEQGARKPSGAAMALLKLLQRRPDLIREFQ